MQIYIKYTAEQKYTTMYVCVDRITVGSVMSIVRSSSNNIIRQTSFLSTHSNFSKGKKTYY